MAGRGDQGEQMETGNPGGGPEPTIEDRLL